MPPASCCLLVAASELASSAGPQAWPRFMWMRITPAYLGFTTAVLLGRLIVLPLFVCLGFKEKCDYRLEQMWLNLSGKNETVSKELWERRWDKRI